MGKNKTSRAIPPPFRELPGRPSDKKRRKEAGEVAEKNNFVKRVKKPNKCGKCGQLGHNRSTCKNAPLPVQPQNKGGRPTSNTPWATSVREKNNKVKAARTIKQTQMQQSEASYTSGPQSQQSQTISRSQQQVSIITEC
ncbi:hypothetical protein RND81_03G129200 [Saponaria officinalis]|uniref:CCHC-type domain-containing protein n=1 Tax=Saponaria officinalis TaxID=3572 RepID=A0AAW1M6R2_SAPOF